MSDTHQETTPAGVGDEQAEAPAKKQKRAPSTKPDFSSDKRFEQLVAVFDVSSINELNTLRLEDFRKKAAELLLSRQGDVP